MTACHRQSDLLRTHRTPSPLEEAGEEVDAHKRDVSRRRHRHAFLGRFNADVQTCAETASETVGLIFWALGVTHRRKAWTAPSPRTSRAATSCGRASRQRRAGSMRT